jgi:hypothetical protein
MDVRKRLLTVLLAALLLAASSFRPQTAVAEDAATTGAIVGACIGGAVAVITLIAIIFANRDDPEVMPLAARAPATPRWDGHPRWAPHCRPDGPLLSLACW